MVVGGTMLVVGQLSLYCHCVVNAGSHGGGLSLRISNCLLF